MTDPFDELDQAVLTAFGQVFEWRADNAAPAPLQGVLRRNVQAAGAFDAVMQTYTELAIPNTFTLQRNDQISKGGERWRVDRKLKDDGSLAKWSLHADRS
ncbi:head-tail joining protein [Sansalvadorimonas verongulae]|uniref:head-tail joining protein n=1 Tax=Sansalvadorimonas verongulae TaxID=2172824 RepID=UPI0012BC4A44|nr:hypothetical protein [Sansalvadorimonas verongulae]MTI15143.1 hypothetical protein [Sansalvadorimonas verongulae]